MASVPEIKIVRSESLGHRSEVSSPEAKLGMRVEDLWDEQKPQLSPDEKLNACFESIPVSAFPLSSDSQDIEIRSDTSLAEAVETLSKLKVLSAPVVDVDAPEDASWIDRYIGIVEFPGIVVWLLHQLDPTSPRSPAVAGSNGTSHDFTANGDDSAVTSGNFFEVLTSSELYKNTKVRDISGTFRWAPFLALQKDNSFLTMLLLLSKYKMKSIPVVDLGEAKIENIITQSGVIHMLAECVGLHWFEDWGVKTLSEVGLPIMSKDHIIKIYEDEPVLQAFKLMRRKRIGGIPVIERKSEKPVGNISLRDVHFLLTAPEIYHDYRSITTKNFLVAVREHLEKRGDTSAPILSGVIACTKNHTLKELILMLDAGNEMLKKTSTGITNGRDYQLLWRHLAYRDSLLPVDDNALPLDDDSDMECELETSPAVNVDVVSEAVAHVKVIASSFVPSDLDIPEDSTFEAPLTINIPYGHRGPQEPSDSYWSSKGMNITFPISLQKAAEGHNGNGLASSVAARKKRKKWSAEEDEELIAAVKRHGEGSWVTISKEEFEGERTVSQLSQRWGFLRKRGDTSNSSTQSGLHRTEEQMAANRALSLAVGNRVPSKKAAVGIPPVRTSGTITGAQANGANNGNSLQGQQQSQPVVQATPRVATSIPTTKSRVPAKKTTANSTSRSALMVTANSVAAAACMSGLATTASVPKVEPVIKASPAAASFPRPSAISSALNAEPVKNASPSATSFPRPSGISSALNAERVKAASAASFPRPSGISSALNVVPVKTGPLGVISASKAEPFKTAPVAFLPRPSGTISAPNAEAVKAASAVSLPGPSSIISASKAEPVKSVAAAGPSNVRNAVTGSPRHVLSSSPMAPFSKGPTIQNNPSPGFASSRLAPTQRVPAANVIPQKPNAGAGVTATCKPVGVQTQGNRANPMVTPTLQSNKAISTNSVITTAKPVAAKVETPSLLPKHTQVPQTEVGSGTEKSSLAKPSEKESSTTVSPLVVAEAESKSKGEESKGKSPDVATVTGTEKKGS